MKLNINTNTCHRESDIPTVARRWLGCIFAVFASGILLSGLSGCGGPAYEYDAIVTGTVTVDGDLAKSGTVTFHPVDDGKPAFGRIHPDGSYSLRTGQGDLQLEDGGTVVPGEYLVTVSVAAPPAEGSAVAEGGPSIPGPSLVAARYATTETTDLKQTVKKGSQVIVLNLDAAESAPPEATGESAEQQQSAPESAAPESAADGTKTSADSTPSVDRAADTPTEESVQ